MRNIVAQLARDSAIYGLSTVVQRLLTFLLTPLYTNVLSPAQLGDVAQLYSLMALMGVVAVMGFEQAFLRYWVDYPSPRVVLTHALGGVLSSAVFVCGGVAIAADTVAQLLGLASGNGSELVRLACIIVLLDSIAAIPFAFLRMERRAQLFAMVRLAVVAINVGLNVVLVALWQWQTHGVLIAGVISSLVGTVMVLPLVRGQLEGRFNGSLLQALLHFGIPTVPAALAAMVLQVADRPILGWLTNQATVGIYNANYRLAIPMMLAVSVYETAWKPLYLHHAQQADTPRLLAQVFAYYVAAALVLFVAWSAFVGDLVALPIAGGHVIGRAYWSGLPIVPIVMGGYFALGLSTTFAAGLVITKRTGFLPLVNGIAAVTNILLNLLLIPQMGYVGAAWATFGAYAIAAAGMLLASQRSYHVPYPWSTLGVAVVGAVVSIGVLRLLPQQGAWGAKLAVVVAAALCSTAIVRIGRRFGAGSPMAQVHVP